MCSGRKRDPAVQRRIIAVPASVAKASGTLDMPLLQPSFRGRLRLFFAVIVIVPIIAVGFVLFRLIDTADDCAGGFESQHGAARGAEPVRRLPPLSGCRRSTRSRTTWNSRRRSRTAGGWRSARGSRRCSAAPGRCGSCSRRRTAARSRPVRTWGSPPPDGISSTRTARRSRLVVSMVAADRYAGEVARALDIDVRVDRDERGARVDAAARGTRVAPERARRRGDAAARTSTARRSSRPRSPTARRSPCGC